MVGADRAVDAAQDAVVSALRSLDRLRDDDRRVLADEALKRVSRP